MLLVVDDTSMWVWISLILNYTSRSQQVLRTIGLGHEAIQQEVPFKSKELSTADVIDDPKAANHTIAADEG